MISPFLPIGQVQRGKSNIEEIQKTVVGALRSRGSLHRPSATRAQSLCSRRLGIENAPLPRYAIRERDLEEKGGQYRPI